MNREEAIEKLNALAWVQGGPDREEMIEAVSMAIEALSAEPTDLISRVSAIERFCELGTSLERQGKTLITMVDAKYAFIKTLESLPSSGRQSGEWIIRENGNKECSLCGHERQDGWDYFCGYCGAIMKVR